MLREFRIWQATTIVMSECPVVFVITVLRVRASEDRVGEPAEDLDGVSCSCTSYSAKIIGTFFPLA